MSKSKKILLAVAIVAIIALLAGAKFTSSADSHTGTNALRQCVECEGVGHFDCEECAGTGSVDGSLCIACEGTGTVDCEECEGTGMVRASWWALVPPVIAIGLALITKEVYSSLFVGILAGSILGSNFSFTGTMDILTSNGLIDAVSGTAGIFIFLVVLGAIVALVNKAGGSAAFGKWAQTPPMMLTRFFREAFPNASGKNLLVLKGKILTFEADEGNKKVNLNVSYSISNEGKSETLFSFVLRNSTPMKNLSAEEYAEAMRQALIAQVNEVKRRIQEKFSPKK